MQSLKDHIKISDFIGEYVSLKAKGSNYVGLCPFHDEKTPSFTVNNGRGNYKCFGCGVSGDIIQFDMDYNSRGYVESIKFISSKYHIPVELNTKQYDKPIPRQTTLSESTINYFHTRGISFTTLQRLGVTETKEWMPGADKEVPAICFNYYRGDDLVNIKFRAKNKDFKLAKNAELIFYNINSLQDENTAIIVEGEIDCLSLHEAGIYNSVSVPNGANVKGEINLSYLDNCWLYFENKTKIILAVDNDETGNRLREELARRLGKDKCYTIQFPSDCKDINDLLVKHTRNAVSLAIEHAIPWPIEGIHTMDDMYEDVVYFYEHGYPKGKATKIPGMDEFITFAGGQITMVTGIPGSGKSEFLDYIATSLTIQHGWKWGVCSFENQPSSFHVTKLMEKISKKSFQFRADHSQRISKEDFEYSVGIVDAYFNFININKVDVTIDGILEKAKELVQRKGIKGLIIDPWNYVEHKVPAGQTETQYISESLTKIKAFALQTDIHIFMVAHPTKIPKDKSTGEYEVPTLYSISGSAHFFNKTDNGICVYRSFRENRVTVYIQKVRYSWLGKLGYTEFFYNTFTRQYEPVFDVQN